MPLPTPKKEESKDGFVSRCIENDVMNDEFPNLTQRIAVCVSQWDNKDKPKKEKEYKDDVRKNPDCPDGFEHLMPNGEYMCGKTHKTKKKKTGYGNETYDDYPQSATNNAKRVLKYVDENGWGSCGTDVGKKRCHQIADRVPLSRDTISRVASFKRHQQYKDVPFDEGCGGLMWNAWGGTSMVEWAIKKLKQIDKK